MNRKCASAAAGIVALVMLFSFAACSTSDEGSADSGKSSTQVSAEDLENAPTKEEDGVVKVAIPSGNFVGTWTADSAKAEHLYGSLEITLNEDNTWTGKVTGEDLHGTWEEKDFGVHLYDEVVLWECDLFYTDKDNFVLSDGMKVVLTRQ